MPVRFRLDALLTEKKGVIPTQAELARRSGVSTVTISDIVLNNTKQVRLDTLYRLCTALECSPGELFELVPERAKRSRG